MTGKTATAMTTIIFRRRKDIKEVTKMLLPEDPYMLLSVVNMKLRDCYPSLDALCDDLEVDRQELEAKLKAVGFVYDSKNKKFY